MSAQRTKLILSPPSTPRINPFLPTDVREASAVSGNHTHLESDDLAFFYIDGARSAILHNPFALGVLAKVASGGGPVSDELLASLKEWLSAFHPKVLIEDTSRPGMGFVWGFVDGHGAAWWQRPAPRNDRQKLHISGTLVKLLRDSKDPTSPLHDLHLSYAAMYVWTYLHELGHGVTFAYGERPTPKSMSGAIGEKGFTKGGKTVRKGHSGDWIEVQLGGGQAFAHFSDGSSVGDLTKMVQLGIKIKNASGGIDTFGVKLDSDWLLDTVEFRWGHTTLTPPTDPLDATVAPFSCRVSDLIECTDDTAEEEASGSSLPSHLREPSSPSPKSSTSPSADRLTSTGEHDEDKDEDEDEVLLARQVSALSFGGGIGDGCLSGVEGA